MTDVQKALELGNAYYVTCPHCGGSGTCDKGGEGYSCKRCSDRMLSRFGRRPTGSYKGVVCAVCWGKGAAELGASKWNYRYPALLAAGLVFMSFVTLGLFAWLAEEELQHVLVFVGTLTGSITGYYFGGDRSSRNSNKPDRKKEEG